MAEAARKFMPPAPPAAAPAQRRLALYADAMAPEPIEAPRPFPHLRWAALQLRRGLLIAVAIAGFVWGLWR